jgi:hypothetical protein
MLNLVVRKVTTRLYKVKHYEWSNAGVEVWLHTLLTTCLKFCNVMAAWKLLCLGVMVCFVHDVWHETSAGRLYSSSWLTCVKSGSTINMNAQIVYGIRFSCVLKTQMLLHMVTAVENLAGLQTAVKLFICKHSTLSTRMKAKCSS